MSRARIIALLVALVVGCGVGAVCVLAPSAAIAGGER
jgi:hypothetical protein